MAVPFPADLVASLRRHDGVTSTGAAFTFPLFYDSMPVGRIVTARLSLCTSPASVAELLEKTAASLRTGRPFDNRYRPTITADGVLDWQIV